MLDVVVGVVVVNALPVVVAEQEGGAAHADDAVNNRLPHSNAVTSNTDGYEPVYQ